MIWKHEGLQILILSSNSILCVGIGTQLGLSTYGLGEKLKTRDRYTKVKKKGISLCAVFIYSWNT